MDALISTCEEIKDDYEIVDIIFAAQTIRTHFIYSGGRETLKFFPALNEKLKEEAKRKGCDAVIGVRINFEYAGQIQVMIAYGTGVKFKKTPQ